MIITIDGYSWLGKSYVGKCLAEKINFDYFPTGILVRFVANEFVNIKKSNDIRDQKAIDIAVGNLEKTNIRDISFEHLYTKKVEQTLEIVARFPQITLRLNRILRRYILHRNIVLDGHFTFLLFPEAYKKYYFQSTITKRATLVQKVKKMSMEEAIKYINYRDSFEKKVEIPEFVCILDPFSYSLDELVAYMMEDIKSV